MAESYGWAGKILRVNLTTGEITTQDDEKYHKYIGGMGMAYRIMYEEAPMELDPYDEKALVIFGVGPLTGAGVPCSGRMNVTFRSTWSKGHSIIDAHMGGHIGSMLKYAGYDGIVVSGISEKPVYLRIEDGAVSLEDATEIWGKGTFAANKWMVEQNGREFETASIGPAGENLVDYSTLNTSFGNSGGAGLGAAMGNKKLKGLAIRGTGSVKVADFGIACLANSANTLTQEALGSVHYMSPEQARGDRTDARSDIYSAGVVLYEMLTGRLPFEGDNAVSVAIQHLSSVPLSPREINPDVPEALELICMKAMASDLEKRYASADEMLADLEEFRKNPEVDLDFTIEDLHRETVDEPTQYIPAVHTVSKAQKMQEADDEEEEEASPHKLGTRKLLTIIGAAVAAVALIVLLWHAIFSDLLGGEQTPTEYVVPYLIGMTIDEANEDENVKGIFTIEQIGQRASSKYAAGQIIEQSPERGKTVKGNRVISVFVSSGAKTEKMPNLINKEYRDATLQLTNLDLNLVVNDPVEEYSNITKGYVIRTIPEYGETLQEGDSVTLVVSKGEQPKPVTVLSFIGIDIEIVRQQVTQTGLVVGEVTQRASDEPYGTVIDQSINAETKVDAGTTINFVISEGPAMPDYGDDATTSGGEPQP